MRQRFVTLAPWWLHEIAGFSSEAQSILLQTRFSNPGSGFFVQVLHQRQQFGVGRVIRLLFPLAEHLLPGPAAPGLL